MRALLTPFLELCLLRFSPQQLPGSTTLLGVALLAYLASGVLFWAVTMPVPQALLAAVTDTALLGLLTASVLYPLRLGARLLQTLTALAGTGALLGLVGLPVAGWFYQAKDLGQDVSTPALILLLVVGWSIAVGGHILRHALSTHYALGLVVAVVFYWISANVMHALFPVGI